MPSGQGFHCYRRAAIAAAVLVLAGNTLHAQALTGTLQGRLSDSVGRGLGNVQVVIVGTSFNTVTQANGSYILRGVPPARYTIRAGIDSGAAEVADVAVHAGETRTIDLVAGSRGAQAGGASRAFDQTTSRTYIEEEAFHDLPITTPREAVALQPGVTDAGNPQGVSLRGSDPAGTGTFVDGAPVRNGQRGEVDLVLGNSGIAEASVTTGVLDAGTGNAEGGAISFVTASGGNAWHGSFRYRTDYPGFEVWQNIGLNLLEARLGGPIHGGLTFFTTATLTGQQSLDTQKDRDILAPVYVMGGVDTVVHQPDTWGAPNTDTTAFQFPKFAEYTGDCDAAQNFGIDCQGLRVPYTASSSFSWQGKLQQTYGQGSFLSLTGIASRAQERNFPGQDIYNSISYTGTSLSSYAAIVNWRQTLNPTVAIEVNASYQADRRSAGPLEIASELESRDPFGGFLVSPLRYVMDHSTTHTVQVLDDTIRNVHYLDEQQVQCLQAGYGACRGNDPFPNGSSPAVQPYRLNPYGVEQSSLLPLYTAGLYGPVDLADETRLQTRAGLEWLSGRGGRVRIGGQVNGFEMAHYSSEANTFGPTGLSKADVVNAYRERPLELGAFVEDRLDLGDVVLIAGVRWDRFDSRASYPAVPGRISTMPVLPSDSVCYAPGATRPPGVPECTIIPGATKPFDPTNPEAQFIPASAHSEWSPRFQFLYSLNRRSHVRFSYGRQVQVPPYDLLFAAMNTDLAGANRTVVFARDIGFTITTLTELGFRHLFGRATLLDVAAYHKGFPAQPVIRILQLPDPNQPTSTRNVYDTGDCVCVIQADLGNVNGVDAWVEHRVSDVFNATAGYTYESASDLTVDARQAVVGTAHLAAPAGWHSGSLLGAIFANSSAFLTFRFTNGERYTQVVQQSLGFTVENPGGVRSEDLGASRMPWTSTLDLRLTRAFHVARLNARLFLETANLVNVTNVFNRFTETNADTNAQYRNRFINEQSTLLTGEAAGAGILNGTTVDFTALSGGCAGWQGRNSGNFSSGPVDCVALTRAERLYGNGDGVYTQAEYQKAFGAWYDFLNAPSAFYGPGRRIRVGAEIVF